MVLPDLMPLEGYQELPAMKCDSEQPIITRNSHNIIAPKYPILHSAEKTSET